MNNVETKVIVRRLLGLVKPYQSRAWMALLSMAITAATQPLLGEALKVLLDDGFKENIDFSLWWIPAILV